MPEERTTSSTGGQKGVKLARFDLIPAGPLLRLAEHFGKGAKKYAEHQWRDGYEWSKSYSAINRHLNAFWSGLEFDVCSNEPDNCSFVTNDGEEYIPTEPDTCYNHTGSHHLDCVMWHSFVMREFVETCPEHDDRYLSRLEKEDEEEFDLDRNRHEIGMELLWPFVPHATELPHVPLPPYFKPKEPPHAHFNIDAAGDVSTDF